MRSRFFYYVNPKTSFVPRLLLMALFLALPPVVIYFFAGEEWTETLLNSGIYFTASLAVLGFVVKYNWEATRKRYNALAFLEQEILLQITTLADSSDKLETLVQAKHPIFANPALIIPDLGVLRDIARVDLKNRAFNTLSRIHDVKVSLDHFAAVTIQEAAGIRNCPQTQNIILDKMRGFKTAIDKYINDLEDIDVECKFFLKNDAPTWNPTLPFYSENDLEEYIPRRRSEIKAELSKRNKGQESARFL